jgi:hypothetical protein
MGRRQNNVFVLGDESLVAERIDGQDSRHEDLGDAELQTGQLPQFESPGVGTSSASSSPFPRRLAALGLLAGALAVIAGLTVFAKPDVPPGTLPVAALSTAAPKVSAPEVSAASPPAQTVPHHPAVRRPSPRRRPVSRKPQGRPSSEPEREPLIEEAPVSPPVDVTTPTPAPVTVPVTAPPPTPSAPPPSEGGGASAGKPEFSFER